MTGYVFLPIHYFHISDLYATFPSFLFHRFPSLNQPQAAHPRTHTQEMYLYVPEQGLVALGGCAGE